MCPPTPSSGYTSDEVKAYNAEILYREGDISLQEMAKARNAQWRERRRSYYDYLEEQDAKEWLQGKYVDSDDEEAEERKERGRMRSGRRRGRKRRSTGKKRGSGARKEERRKDIGQTRGGGEEKEQLQCLLKRCSIFCMSSI
mgnify:CR=1 FL=1